MVQPCVLTLFRRRRNRGITLMLIGIIVVFLVCHIGEIFLSLYELYELLDGQRSGEFWLLPYLLFTKSLFCRFLSYWINIHRRENHFRDCFCHGHKEWLSVQGGHSACSKPPVEIDVEVAFKYNDLILKRTFQINVNRRFCTSWMVTLYSNSVKYSRKFLTVIHAAICCNTCF